MNLIIFYEKPGCTTNKKQKKLLRDSGCVVIERNLLEHGMDTDDLYSFFKGRPVSDWFNPNAPQIKTGYVNPKNLSEQEALKLLLTEPILIKRPLLLVGKQRMGGFDQVKIENLLNITLGKSVPDTCTSAPEPCFEKKRKVS